MAGTLRDRRCWHRIRLWDHGQIGLVFRGGRGSGIPFVFGTHTIASAFAGEGVAANALAEFTMDTWLAFAKTGDPSTNNLPWPTWDEETRQTVVLGESARIEDDYRGEEIAAWQGIL